MTRMHGKLAWITTGSQLEHNCVTVRLQLHVSWNFFVYVVDALFPSRRFSLCTAAAAA